MNQPFTITKETQDEETVITKEKKPKPTKTKNSNVEVWSIRTYKKTNTRKLVRLAAEKRGVMLTDWIDSVLFDAANIALKNSDAKRKNVTIGDVLQEIKNLHKTLSQNHKENKLISWWQKLQIFFKRGA